MGENGNGQGVSVDSGTEIQTDFITLTRFLTEQQVKSPHATGDFTYVLLYTIFHLMLYHKKH